MNARRSLLMLVALTLLSVSLTSTGSLIESRASAAATLLTLPDLKINVPPSQISIGTNSSTGHRQLQFTHQTWDAGSGPFAILPTRNQHTGVSTFVQLIYRSPSPGNWVVDHTSPIAVAGVFQSPSDYQFPLTRFTLRKGSALGPIVAVSPKVDYCITGDAYIGGVPNTPASTSPPQNDCSNPNALLGFSVGWGDQYDQTDNGQPIDLTAIADGIYVLVATVDPQHIFQETKTSNNVTATTLSITGSTVSVLSQSFPTTPVPSISLTSPAPGATVSGTVTLQSNASAVGTAGVASVRYLLDGEPLGSPVTTAPYSFGWGTLLSTGTHSLSAQVTDSNGTVGTAAVRSVTIRRSSSGGLALDASAIGTGHGTVAATPVSSSVAGDTLVALVAADGPSVGYQQVVVAGGGLKWHLVRRSNGQAGDAEIWSAFASKLLRKASISSSERFVGYAQQIQLLAWSGSNGVGSSNVASSASGAPGVVVKSTSLGSILLGVGADWDSSAPRTVINGQAMISQWLDQSDGDTFWVQGTNTTTTRIGKSVLVGDSAPTTDRWNMVGVELRAASRSTLAVTLASPLAGETLTGSVPVTVAINDSRAIGSVHYFVDDRAVTMSTAGHVAQSPRWNTAILPNGRHDLMVQVTDASGRTVSATVMVNVANPAPAMTCFVLNVNVSVSGARTVTTPIIHVTSLPERLVAFVRTPSVALIQPTIVGGGSWRLVQREIGPNGTIEVWTAMTSRSHLNVQVTSRVGRGVQDLTVIAIEGTRGVGASKSGTYRGGATSSITTSAPVALLFAVAIQSSAHAKNSSSWTTLSFVRHRVQGTLSWVRYFNQPVMSPGTRVGIISSTSNSSSWSSAIIELPGTGN